MAKIDITARLNAASVDGILANANQIYDENMGKFQTAVNEDLDKRLKEQDGRLERYHDDLVDEVDREVAETIETTQETIDQLKEASEWLKNDPSGAQAIMEQTNQNTANIATISRNTGIDEYSQFSTGMDYSAGAVVLYDGVLFRFKADHAKGEWDYNEVEKWSEKKEREELGQYEDNPEYARAYTDAEGRFLWGIKQDGSIEFAKGVPTPIKNYIVEFVIKRIDNVIVPVIETLKEAHEQYLKESENPEWARVIMDAEGKVLWGIRQDGSVEFTKGIPTSIKAYIDSLDRNNDEEVERINQLVIGLLADVKVLNDTYHYVSNSEWVCAIVDAEERILMGIKADGSYYIPNRDMYHVESNPEYAKVVVDSEGRVLFGIKTDGSCYIPKGISEEAKNGLLELTARISWFEEGDNPEWLQVTTDSEGRILEGIGNDGKKYLPKQDMLEKYQDVEGRTEMTLDAEGKVLSYRGSDGTRHELKMAIENALSLGTGAMSDLQKSLIESGFNVDTPVDWSNESTISLPIPRYCAKVNIVSKTGLAINKTQDKKCILQYWDKSGNYFQKYIILNAQGSSSMAYIEKNQSIDVFNDEDCEESCDIIFGEWVAQDSFHLKCYYIDVFRGIANVAYNYCEEVIQYLKCRNNRVVLDNSAISKDNSTGDFDVDFGDGALCHPDGFPFEMYVNGEYYGLFAWNLKKHRKNYSMNKKDYTVALLDGVIDAVTFFNGIIDWTQFELRNPKDLVTMDGREYDADTNCNDLMDSTSSSYDSSNSVHVKTSQIKAIIERQANAIPLIKAESNIESAKDLYEQYYDVDAMACFFIISNVIYNYDGFRKNWIWTIYNNIAAPSFYDLDSIFGRSWTGTTVVEGSVTNILGTSSSLPTGQLVRLYKEDIEDMYSSMRKDKVIDVAKIMSYVYSWIGRVGRDAYKKNIEAWPSIPSYREERNQNDGTYDGGFYDSAKRIELWLTERIAYLDNYFNYNV